MKLEVGKRYLVYPAGDKSGLELTLLEVTENSYKLRNNITGIEAWLKITDIEKSTYEIIELGGHLKVEVNKFVNKSGVPQLTKKDILDAGYDIASAEDVTIFPNSSNLISTELYVEILPDYVGIIKSRSGLSINYSVEVGAGVIDSSYRGEVKVHIYNYGTTAFRINKGDRIAQLLIIPICSSFFIEVAELSTTERGEKGFGSTGV